MQKLDSNGIAKWTTNGVIVCDASGNQSALDFLTVDGTGETIIAWKDNRSGSDDIYVQKINGNGLAQWTSNGKVICNAAFDQINPNICSNQHDGAIIVWQDSTAVNNWDIKAQHITNNGVLQWSNNGIVVSNAFEEQNGPKNVTDNRGGTIIAWQDKRSGFNDIYAHHLWQGGYIPLSLLTKSDEEPIVIYPNPANTYFDIQTDKSIVSIEVYNLVGQMVLKKYDVTSRRIDVKNLVKGLYMLKVATSKNSFIQKIMITN
jgi:Secretion system C-terminal sorting domain